LLARATLPVELPAAKGANVASNVADCPGARISPAETPLAEKEAPDRLTFDKVTLEFPAFVSVTDDAPLFPIATFPKLNVDVLAVRSALAAVPSPLKETVFGKLERLVVTEISLDKPPAAFGEKTTLKVACFPAAMVSGFDVPEIVTPAAVVLTFITVSFDPPLFVMVTD
jgi:hypothetical protein